MSAALNTGPKRYYLSGPMTGLPEMNFPAFNAAEQYLRERGLQVVNPVRLGVPGGTWHDCMRADIKALCDCHCIVLLPGWEKSDGANLELHLAHRLGLSILFLDALQEDLVLADLVADVAAMLDDAHPGAAPTATPTPQGSAA